MPLTLVEPKPGRSPFYRVRGHECGISVDRSTKTCDRRTAQKLLVECRDECRRVAVSCPNQTVEPTFAEAGLSYLQAGGEGRFLDPILAHFGVKPLGRINQNAIDAAAVALYPDATAATRNRQVYSPISAVLRHAGILIPLNRPKGAQGQRRLQWLKPEEASRLLASAEALDPKFGALCRFLLYTGCRLSEGLELDREDLHLDEGFAYVRETKNGDPRPVHLPQTVVDSLKALAETGTTRRRKVFGCVKGGHLYQRPSRPW